MNPVAAPRTDDVAFACRRLYDQHQRWFAEQQCVGFPSMLRSIRKKPTAAGLQADVDTPWWPESSSRPRPRSALRMPKARVAAAKPLLITGRCGRPTRSAPVHLTVGGAARRWRRSPSTQAPRHVGKCVSFRRASVGVKSRKPEQQARHVVAPVDDRMPVQFHQIDAGATDVGAIFGSPNSATGALSSLASNRRDGRGYARCFECGTRIRQTVPARRP